MRFIVIILICLAFFSSGCNAIYQISLFRHIFGKDEDDVETIPFFGAWADVEHLQVPRSTACAQTGGKIYACGGEDSTGALDNVEMYDSGSDVWSSINSLPAPASGHVCVAFDDRIYVFGGSGGSYCLETLTGQWGAVAGPQPTYHASGAACEGKIYYFGGSLDSGFTCSSTQVYDPEYDSWSIGSSMPGGRAGAFCEEINGKIYVIGGAYSPSSPALETYNDTVFEYIPSLDYWSAKSPMSLARAYGASAVINSRVVIIGGISGTYPGLVEVEVYNPVWDSWMSLYDEPGPRSFTCDSAFGTRIYVIGGKVGETSYTALVREFISP